MISQINIEKDCTESRDTNRIYFDAAFNQSGLHKMSEPDISITSINSQTLAYIAEIEQQALIYGMVTIVYMFGQQ